MPTFSTLLLCFGICFGLQNKVVSIPLVQHLIYQYPAVRKLFRCSYCMGFHAGWLAYLLSLFAGVILVSGCLQWFSLFILWGLIGSAFSYTLDTGLKWIEASTLKIKLETEQLLQEDSNDDGAES